MIAYTRVNDLHLYVRVLKGIEIGSVLIQYKAIERIRNKREGRSFGANKSKLSFYARECSLPIHEISWIYRDFVRPKQNVAFHQHRRAGLGNPISV